MGVGRMAVLRVLKALKATSTSTLLSEPKTNRQAKLGVLNSDIGEKLAARRSTGEQDQH